MASAAYPDLIEILPTERFETTVTVPGSKSITNRAYILAALAEGNSTLHYPLDSDDTSVMRTGLREIGVEILDFDPAAVKVEGRGGQFKAASGTLDVHHAGTSMRFLTALSTLVPARTALDGSERMRQRPLGDLIQALSQLGVSIQSLNQNNCPPVSVDSTGLPGGTCTLNGAVSSQFLSAILMVAPYAQQDISILIEGELTSKPYVDITLDLMQRFGVSVKKNDYQRFEIQSGQRYQGQDYAVEADASSASYLMAMAAITGGKVRIDRFHALSAQGDSRFPEVLAQMGCTVESGQDWVSVQGPDNLSAVTLDLNAMPDMVQTLGVVAAFAEGTTVITNIGNLRVKETDRLQALETELGKMGVQVRAGEDFIEIEGGNPHGATIDTYEDHRMAMAFAVAGLRVPGLRIRHPQVVSKSFPDFWETLKRAGVQWQPVEEV